MSSLSIQTVNGQSAFRPGQEIQGTIAWALERPAPALVLELRWTTRGKGEADTQVVETLKLESPPLQGQQEFRFCAPEFPYSFSGRLLSLLWSLELEIPGSGQRARFPITLSPTGQEIELLTAL